MVNYGGLSGEYTGFDSSAIVILPVPFDDGSSTWIKRADKGPEAILEASANMELYDIETGCEVFKEGVFTAPLLQKHTIAQEMFADVYKNVGNYLTKGKFVVTIGGTHSVSIGAAKAYVEKYPNLTVLHLGAHSNLRPEFGGMSYNQSCTMNRIKEYAPIVQVGIRSMDKIEVPYMDKNRVFFATDIMRDKDWMNEVLELLTENVYLTINLDVFDPGIMPSTGKPEPGGLLWYDVIDLLKMVIDTSKLVGFDVVELCPNPENKAPDFLASKLIYQLISYKFAKKPKKK